MATNLNPNMLSPTEKLDIVLDPNTSESTLNLLLSDLSWLEELLNSDYSVRMEAETLCDQLCANPNTSPELLYKLWKIADSVDALQNPNAPIQLLWEVAEDHALDVDDYYQYNLVCNPNLPAELLDMLCEVPSEEVREIIANHPNVSTKTLWKMYDKGSADIAEQSLKDRGEL